MTTRHIRSLSLPLLLAAALAATGCAALRSVSSDVATYGDWPSARQPGSYAFERLPSQQAQSDETDRIEAAARSALEKAGFKPAAGGSTPDVLVQVGVRTTRSQPLIWDDPLWWRGGFGSWRYAPFYGPGWRYGGYGGYGGWGGYGAYGLYRDRPVYDREVAVLLRDSSSGKPLFEAHASNESTTGSDAVLLQAMFEAALLDFPRTGINPRRVVVQLPPQS